MTGIGPAAAAAAVLATLALPALAGAAQHRHAFSGIAAYYDQNYRGRTASGARYDAHAFTAAHKTLPFGTRLKVIDARTGRSVEVTVNDRGPFNRGRVLDLSLAAAKQLGIIQRGLARVTAEVLR